MESRSETMAVTEDDNHFSDIELEVIHAAPVLPPQGRYLYYRDGELPDDFLRRFKRHTFTEANLALANTIGILLYWQGNDQNNIKVVSLGLVCSIFAISISSIMGLLDSRSLTQNTRMPADAPVFRREGTFATTAAVHFFQGNQIAPHHEQYVLGSRAAASTCTLVATFCLALMMYALKEADPDQGIDLKVALPTGILAVGFGLASIFLRCLQPHHTRDNNRNLPANFSIVLEEAGQDVPAAAPRLL